MLIAEEMINQGYKHHSNESYEEAKKIVEFNQKCQQAKPKEVNLINECQQIKPEEITKAEFTVQEETKFVEEFNKRALPTPEEKSNYYKSGIAGVIGLLGMLYFGHKITKREE